MITLILTVLLFPQHGATEPSKKNADQSEYRDAGAAHFKFAQIRVPVWVRNRNNAPAHGLLKKHFKLKVDGVKTPISYFAPAFEQEIDVLFLLDLSGSMALGRKLEASKKVILYLVNNLREGDHWQLVVFADKQVIKVLDDSQGEYLKEVLKKARAYGKTALYDALLKSPGYFTDRGPEQRVVFLFTDGHDNNSILSFEETRYLMKNLNTPLFSIGIMDGFLPSLEKSEDPLNVGTLRALSTAGGGELFIARDHSDLLDLKTVLRENLRAHYMIGFMVERGAGERRHQISVLTKKKLHIRHRNSYIGLPP